MLKTIGSLLFWALAAASPPLLWIFREPIRLWLEGGYARQDDTFAGIVWFFLSVTAVLAFVVLAFATWASQSEGEADMRRLGLVAFGAVSLAAGLLTLAYLNLLIKEWGFRPFLIEWGPGVVMLASGLFAIREWRRAGRVGVAGGSGNGHAEF